MIFFSLITCLLEGEGQGSELPTSCTFYYWFPLLPKSESFRPKERENLWFFYCKILCNVANFFPISPSSHHFENPVSHPLFPTSCTLPPSLPPRGSAPLPPPPPPLLTEGNMVRCTKLTHLSILYSWFYFGQFSHYTGLLLFYLLSLFLKQHKMHKYTFQPHDSPKFT